ncbi:MAG TPA: gamma-glutamyltransferase [Allosphingosinicella sp.]|nr:gamma-glutamyltransferase [Allosphingosinicella sp.]
MLKHLLLPAALFLASCAAAPDARAPAAASASAGPGMVSAADPRAAQAGREILDAGGSAADAALATLVALTVVEPQSSGIGGGGFLVYHDEGSGRTSSFDGREQAPMAAGPDWFFGPDNKPMGGREAVPGGRSVGVPGNIRMMAMAHGRHGKLPWKRLFDPAIRLARDGFAVTPRFHRSLTSVKDLAASTPWGRATYYGADGAPKPVGTLVKNPELAAFLEQVAARGPEWFYTGPNADALVRTVNGAARNPSRMTKGDLASYDAKERAPVCGAYRQYRICGMGPPSSGGTTVYAILKQLERFDMGRMGRDDPAAWHLMAESMRLAYADRELYIADPDHVTVPVAGLFDAGYLRQRSELIRTGRAIPKVAAGTPPGAMLIAPGVDREVPSTSHLVAVDKAGNVASLTSTIEGPFGSGLTVNGYFLNNELTDFSLAPVVNGLTVANQVEPGKRPRSSMAPTIVYGPDGEVRIAVGAAGGPTIIAQVAKTLIAVLDWNMSAQDAIALPVIMGVGDSVRIERGSALEAMAPRLRAMGHNVVLTEPTFKANAIERVGGRWAGAADPRSEGAAVSQ